MEEVEKPVSPQTEAWKDINSAGEPLRLYLHRLVWKQGLCKSMNKWSPPLSPPDHQIYNFLSTPLTFCQSFTSSYLSCYSSAMTVFWIFTSNDPDELFCFRVINPDSREALRCKILLFTLGWHFWLKVFHIKSETSSHIATCGSSSCKWSNLR